MITRGEWEKAGIVYVTDDPKEEGQYLSDLALGFSCDPKEFLDWVTAWQELGLPCVVDGEFIYVPKTPEGFARYMRRKNAELAKSAMNASINLRKIEREFAGLDRLERIYDSWYNEKEG